MNIKALQWLLAHRDVLLQIVEVAKNFSRHKPYIDQWDVVDQIARLLIPVLAKEEVRPATVLGTDDTENPWKNFEEYEVMYFAAGADVQAMGIDWKQLVEVILPIVIAILQAIAAKTP